jgi:hypothetical protein
MHSADRLAAALMQAGLPEMARKARAGYYHDFISPLEFPAMQLASDLTAAGTSEAAALRARHLDGEFDAPAEEA